MIVILALLNDIPILAIAYDKTRVRKEPVRWNMQELITVSSILGVAGVISSFLLFFILQEMKLPEPQVQSIIFCKLIVAGHLTIFVTRTEDWFWKPPHPSAILLHASFWSADAFAWGIFNDTVKKGAFALLRREGLYTTVKP